MNFYSTIAPRLNLMRDLQTAQLLSELNELLATGQYAQALNVCQALVKAKIQSPIPYIYAADVYAKLGQLKDVLSVLRDAKIRLGSEKEIALRFVNVYKQGYVSSYNKTLEEDFLYCVSVSPSAISVLKQSIGKLLFFKYEGFIKAGVMDENQYAILNSDELLLTYLTSTINTEYQFELLICKLRSGLLERCLSNDSSFSLNENLINAICVQSYLNEYVAAISVNEHTCINKLLTNEGLLKSTSLVSMYAENKVIELCEVANSNPWLNCLVRLISEAEQEETIKSQIAEMPRMAARPVSDLVQSQYEEHPYPKWTSLDPLHYLSINEMVDLIPGMPRADNQFQSILVAGCGTGYEPIQLALISKDATITAIDLSKASLAYGIRKAKELGVSNIQWFKADILDFYSPTSFDLINCSGVLHHLQKPEEGLASLVRYLKTGGYLRVALYSRAARGAVNVARELFPMAQHVDLALMRRFRRYVFEGQNPELNPFLTSEDFYSSSGLRDLIFHSTESQFSLPEISNLIERHSLKFVAMDALSRRVYAQFASLHGEEKFSQIEAWHDFEQLYPETFVGMYQMWLQKT